MVEPGPAHKRVGSPLMKDSESAGEGSSKKLKTSQISLPDNAFELRLSAIWFTGEADYVYVGQSEDEGLDGSEYDDSHLWKPTSPPHVDLPKHPSSWSEDNSAYVYRPSNGFSFLYKRSAFIGVSHPDDGDIVNNHNEQSPEFYLHSRHKKRGDGFLNIEEPDIQFAEEDGGYDSDEVERCFSHDEGTYVGWRGDWTRKFLALDNKNRDKHRRRQPQGVMDPALGFVDRVIWNKNVDKEEDPRWGIRVKLEPIPGSTREEDDWCEKCKPLKKRLSSYQIQATVLEVYVKKSFFGQTDGQQNY